MEEVLAAKLDTPTATAVTAAQAARSPSPITRSPLARSMSKSAVVAEAGNRARPPQVDWVVSVTLSTRVELVATGVGTRPTTSGVQEAVEVAPASCAWELRLVLPRSRSLAAAAAAERVVVTTVRLVTARGRQALVVAQEDPRIRP